MQEVCWRYQFIFTHEHITMDGWMDGSLIRHFFPLGSCSPSNLAIAAGSKHLQGFLELGFIQLNGLKTGKLGWCIHWCYITMKYPHPKHLFLRI
jgi:hypothetical protein